MLKLCRVSKVKVLFLVLVCVFYFNLFEFSVAILEKGLLASEPIQQLKWKICIEFADRPWIATDTQREQSKMLKSLFSVPPDHFKYHLFEVKFV